MRDFENLNNDELLERFQQDKEDRRRKLNKMYCRLYLQMAGGLAIVGAFFAVTQCSSEETSSQTAGVEDNQQGFMEGLERMIRPSQNPNP